jgi:C4-dicarboxylate transporter DctM subunit
MSSLAIGFLGIGSVILLIALRVPIGAALGLTAFFGIGFVRNFDVAFTLLRTTPFEFAAHWSLSAIPMFLLMGAVAYYSGVSSALFHAARLWLGALPGGLAVAATFACAGFAAASGASIATAAAMGRITIPEMLKVKYDKGLAAGVVASAGTLGTLIPPSILMVIYGIFAEVSIGKLFIAGILPGILTATVYAGMIVIRCHLNPALAPNIEFKASWGQRFASLRDIWPLGVLIVGIIGGLYGGIFTATEAGAVGALLAFIITWLQGRMTVSLVKDAVLEALSSTARIFFIAVGAVLLTRFLAITGVPVYLGQVVGSWAADPLLLVIAASVVYIILGMFLDPLGVMLLTLPLFLPMFIALDLNLIWFGILVIKYLEIGLITPPVGMNVYVIKSVVGDKIELVTIFKGVAWFLVCDIVVIGLIVAFPNIALWLPGMMK